MKATDKIIPIRPPELVDGEYDQFIGVYKNHVPKFICDRLIDLSNQSLDTDMTSGSYTQDRQAAPGDRREVMTGDTQFPIGMLGRKDESILVQFADAVLHSEVNQYLQAGYLHYIKQYGMQESAARTLLASGKQSCYTQLRSRMLNCIQ